MPVSTAWSTAGAAMLISSVAGLSMAQAIGAFMVSALIIASGFSGLFERDQAYSAGTGGGDDVWRAAALRPERVYRAANALRLTLAIFAVYLLSGRRLLPRYAVIVALLAGLALAAAIGLLCIWTAWRRHWPAGVHHAGAVVAGR